MFQLRPTALLVLAVGIVPSLAAQTPSPSPQPRAASISGLVSAPPTVASEAVPLANGEWLTLEKRDLVWRSGQSASVSKVAVRGKQLDVRETAPNRFTAIFLDSDAAQPIVVKGADRLLGLASEAIKVNFSVEAICLYQDPQSLVHAFVIAKNGVAEQWLLSGPKPQLVRQFALPPHAASCRADDQRQTLFVSEHGVGVWAYDLQREAIEKRQLIAQVAPWGKLPPDVGSIAVLRNGAVIVASGTNDRHSSAHWVQPVGKRWQTITAKTSSNARVDKLTTHFGMNRDQVWAFDKEAKMWRALPVPSMPARAIPDGLPVVEPRAQTEPVMRFGDAADDPAIWVHPSDANKSRVLGTNKKQGLLVYDLSGKQLQLLEVGRINNVDLRQGVSAGGQTWDLAVATQRDEQSLVIFSMDTDGRVTEQARVQTELNDIYGVCSGRSRSNHFDVYANDKDGRFVHVRIDRRDGKWVGEIKRRFKVATQPEGCVVDESQDLIFVGEEKRGVWVLSSRDDVTPALKMVLPVGGVLHADVEGLALYQNGDNSYLVVSSQGNDSFVVLDSRAPYKVRGAFRIGINATRGIDGVSETDGIEVSSRSFGSEFPKGLLVVQDGHKFMPNAPQNFKLVSWEDIASALKLP